MKKYYAITDIDGREVLAIKHEFSDHQFKENFFSNGLNGLNGVTCSRGFVAPSVGYQFFGCTAYGFFKGQERTRIDTTSFWVYKGKHLDLEAIAKRIIPDAIRVDISSFNLLVLDDVALSKTGTNRENLANADEASEFFTTQLAII